ncbi:condensation domain-containing protein [Catenulispora rubra]|uniref:condensation domain-containing protein n=1 Tax=Catenulispora rubra TaxID=280293 RepID=UPI00189278C8|nr:condensation domain-containing protein [Catenulispora rubra]
MNDRIVVPFAGPGSGTGGLTWGQRQIWDAMVATDTSQSLRAVVPLDGAKTVDDLAGELRFFLSRYSSMRSRLVFDEQGRPTQVVAGSGQAELFVLDVPDADDPARAAEELADRWEGTKFDYENEWPMRLAAVRHGGTVTHVVVVLNHLAADAGGVAVMMEDLSAWDRTADVQAKPPAGVPATGLADWQDSPGGQRQSDSALRYWERLLRAAEPERFGPVVPDADDGPRYRQLTFRSPALLAAARTVAARTGGGTAPVLLAAYAVALARTTGVHPVLTQTIVSNRFRPGLAAAIHPVSQNGLLQLDVAEVPFDVAVERAARASVLGSKHAYYDPVQWEALKQRVDRERGVVVDIGCVLNDRRLGSEPDQDAIEPSSAPGTPVWGEPLPLFNERLMVTVDEAPDAIELLVEVDTHAMTAPMVESFVLALESVVLDAARAGEGVRATS